MTKEIIIIAGPNGSGKTTTAKILIEDFIDEYINADEIARGLAPLNPESVSVASGKLLLKRFNELVEDNKSFAYETTGASKLSKRLNDAKKSGYTIYMLFLWLSSPELAIERVKRRVELGGHSIPHNVIRDRYYAGVRNLINYYLPLVDLAYILDNSDDVEIKGDKPKLIAEKLNDDIIINDKHKWNMILKVANDTKRTQEKH